MQRPAHVSASASTSTAASSTSTHKRNTSSIKHVSRPLSPSTVSLYITNLRLLDLDLLPDWPAITSSSFSISDARTRIRCAEWSLYQLFRLYDPHTTAEKLQPFFPPLEPLQSINLRAALYRCLNDLKKTGMLGRETVLRKTLLDECSGDKFWDLCLAFSAALLNRVNSGAHRRHPQPLAQRLGTVHALSKKERECLLPLAIAHKAALSKVLANKQRRRESYMHLYDILREKESDLLRRKSEIQKRPTPSSAETRPLQAIEQNIRRGWVGNDDLKDAIINGRQHTPGDRFLLQPLDSFVDENALHSGSVDSGRDSGILEDIESKAQAQSARVRRWQDLYEKLNAARAESTTARTRAQQSTTATHLRFEKHHDLNLGDVHTLPPSQPSSQPPPKPAYISRYDEILTAMREELRRTHSVRREHTRSRTQPAPLRKPSITLDAVAGAEHSHPKRSLSQRSISPSVPLRPGFTRRVSPRSRSYQQPKVISQREPIPLKSELFSPLKTGRTGSVSPASPASSRLPSPADDSIPSAGIDGLIDDCRDSKRQSQNSLFVGTIDSGVGLGADLAESPRDMDLPASRHSPASSVGESAPSFKKPAIPVSRGASSTSRPSLAERTRMSMSIPTNPTDSEVASLSDQLSPLSSDITPPSTDSISPLKPKGNSFYLAERTRQSISTTTFPLPVRTNSVSHTQNNHSRAQSISTSSSNTGVSPRKPRSSTLQASLGQSDTGLLSAEPATARQQQQRRNITPREKLFDAEAEYDSVFRSRPKIAVSPVLSPTTPAEDDAEIDAEAPLAD